MSDTRQTVIRAVPARPAPSPPLPGTDRPGTPQARGQDTGVEAPPVMSAAQARRSVRQSLREAGSCTADTEANALLVASELVTNANRHGGGATAFTARVDTAAPAAAPVLRITVEDADSALPHTTPHALRERARPSGRGWALVLLLTDARTVTPLPGGGKRITVTVRLP